MSALPDVCSYDICWGSPTVSRGHPTIRRGSICSLLELLAFPCQYPFQFFDAELSSGNHA